MDITTATRTISFFFLLLLAGCKALAEGSFSLQITPNAGNVNLFQGGDFRKLCSVQGVSEDMVVRYLWERNGLFIDSRDDADNLQLYIPDVDLIHIGNYTCTAIISSGGAILMTLGPISGGYLNVLDRSMIIAPTSQAIMEGVSSSLICAFPNGFITWTRNGMAFGNDFSPARFTDEGYYVCDIYYASGSVGASTTVEVRLFVVVPVVILSISRPVYQNLTTNIPVTLSVDFRARQSHDLSVVWWFNNLPLGSDDSRVRNNITTSTGITELMIPQAMRSDAGLYGVVIRSEAGQEGEEPVYSSQEEVTFQLDVTVIPAVPINLHVDQISATTGHISWELNYATLDQRSDRHILSIIFANSRKLLKEITVLGDQTEIVVDGLIPADDYYVILTAINVDGSVSTNPTTFSTFEGMPLIESLNIERINRSTFDIMITLAYTGGGEITSLSVAYRLTSIIEVEGVVPEMEGEGLLVRTVVVLSSDDLDSHFEFIVSVSNEFGYQSSNALSNVSAFDVSTPTSVAGTTSPDLVPVWLISVIASVVTILIMIVVLGSCVAIYCCCHSKKSDKFKISPPSDESGIAHQQDGDILPGNCDLTRSQMNSIPSESSLDKTYSSHKHTRIPSDCSSIGTSVVKATITPSTTASNSPSNLMKSREDKLGSIMEMEPLPHSDDSATESEVDRVILQNQLNQKRMNMSPYSQHDDMIHYPRAPADGSTCASSHQSLPGNHHHHHHTNSQPFYLTSHLSLNQPPQQQKHLYPVLFNYSDPKYLHAPGQRAPAEFVRDCDSMVSDISFASSSAVPSNIIYHNHKLPRPIQHRSPTPYNHDHYDMEESIV